MADDSSSSGEEPDFALLSQLPWRVTTLGDGDTSASSSSSASSEPAPPDVADSGDCALLGSGDEVLGGASATARTQSSAVKPQRRRIRAVESSSEEDPAPASCERRDDGQGADRLSTALDAVAGLAGMQPPCLGQQEPAVDKAGRSGQVAAQQEDGACKSAPPDGGSDKHTHVGTGSNKRTLQTPKKVRVAYNEWIREAQAHEKAGQLARAVSSYKEAMALCSEDAKLLRKIAKLENIRNVRRESRRQSVVLGGGGVSAGREDAAQEGWRYCGVRQAYCVTDGQGEDNAETAYALPSEMYSRLLPYQRDGVRWLWQLHCAGSGGILGDEMGLGKTCQTVIFLAGALACGHARRVLVVAPVSVLAVWSREFDKFCPDLRLFAAKGGSSARVKPMLYHGGSEKGRLQSLTQVARGGGVLITSYGLASNESAGAKLRKVEWDYVVCDEGHRLKNAGIQTSRGMRLIPAAHRLLLTGTPLQNNLHELWALYDFAVPGLLPSAEAFKDEFARPITDGADRDASESQRRLGELRARQLRQLIGPYQLARTKAQVFQSRAGDARSSGPGEASSSIGRASPSSALAIPGGGGGPHARHGGAAASTAQQLDVSKTEWMVWLELSPLQKHIYRLFLDSDRVKDALASSRSPLVALTVLKKICDSPLLLMPSDQLPASASREAEEAAAGGDDEAREEEEEGAGDDDGSVHRMLETWLKQMPQSTAEAQRHGAVPADARAALARQVSASSKMAFVVDLVQQLTADGHKTLVFSQSARMLAVLRAAVCALGLRCLWSLPRLLCVCVCVCVCVCKACAAYGRFPSCIAASRSCSASDTELCTSDTELCVSPRCLSAPRDAILVPA